MNEVSIRLAVLDDIEAVTRLARANEKMLGYVSVAVLKAAAADNRLIVAEVGGVIIGFCNFRRLIRAVNGKQKGDVTIYEIAVAEQYQKRGIGKLLVTYFGNVTIHLKCTEDNPANEFYERIGFTFMGTEAGKKRALNVWKRLSKAI